MIEGLYRSSKDAGRVSRPWRDRAQDRLMQPRITQIGREHMFSTGLQTGVVIISLVIWQMVLGVPAAGQALPTAQLRGAVATPTGNPVAGVEVSILGDTLSTVTDSGGRFLLRNVPLGEHVLRVRRIGFRAQYLATNLRAGESREVTIALTPGAYELPEVSVTARLAKPIGYAWTTKYDEFFRRRMVGLGRYIGRQEIDRKAASHTSELLIGVPGVRVVFGMPGVSPDKVNFIGCSQISVWVDGAELHPLARVNPSPGNQVGGVTTVDVSRILGGRPMGESVGPTEVGEMLERVHPLQIEMMEIYTGPARMQAEFLGNSCGAIVIWTR